jgi:DNA-binding LytR/AlgR family response regulator
MTETRILIAEDETPQRDALVSMLGAAWPTARIVAQCADGLEALEAFDREAPDVAFLDIRMPGLSGMEVAQALSGRAHVVFVTAYEEHAVRAFDEGAVDYLLKPVRADRLKETVRRLEARLHEAPTAIDALLARVRKELDAQRAGLKWITASVGEGVVLFPIEDVIAFQAQDKYTTVLTKSDDAIIRTSLRELAQSLDPDTFWQVHRSAIVRATAIEIVKRDELGKLFLTLRGRPERLPISDAFRGRFRGM